MKKKWKDIKGILMVYDVEAEYRIENNTRPVTIDKALSKELNGIMRKVLRLYHDKGIKIILTDLNTILKGLNEEKA